MLIPICQSKLRQNQQKLIITGVIAANSIERVQITAFQFFEVIEVLLNSNQYDQDLAKEFLPNKRLFTIYVKNFSYFLLFTCLPT